MPHALHDTTVVGPVLHGFCVSVVDPSLGIERCTVVVVDEVEAVDGRILACELIESLGILGVPVYVGYGSGEHVVAEVLFEISIELLRLFGSISVDGSVSDVEERWVEVVVSFCREREGVVAGEVVGAVSHRRLHDVDLVVHSRLGVEGYDELFAVGSHQRVYIIIGGVVGVDTYGSLGCGDDGLVVCHDDVGEGVDVGSVVSRAYRDHLRSVLIIEGPWLAVVAVVVGAAGEGRHSGHSQQKDM